MELEKKKTEYVDAAEEDLTGFLIDPSDVWMEHESDRPRIELWPDEEGWDRWVSSHEEKRRNALCSLRSMKASPFCALGYL